MVYNVHMQTTKVNERHLAGARVPLHALGAAITLPGERGALALLRWNGALAVGVVVEGGVELLRDGALSDLRAAAGALKLQGRVTEWLRSTGPAAAHARLLEVLWPDTGPGDVQALLDALCAVVTPRPEALVGGSADAARVAPFGASLPLPGREHTLRLWVSERGERRVALDCGAAALALHVPALPVPQGRPGAAEGARLREALLDWLAGADPATALRAATPGGVDALVAGGIA